MWRKYPFKKIVFLSMVSILSFFVYYFILIIPPASEYEISIYSAYPLVFWISFVGLVTICGLLIIFNCMRPKLQFFVIIYMLSLYILLLSLPIARGYFIFGRGDVFGHIGKIKDVLLQGRTSSINLYPAMHILAAQIVNIASIDVYSISMYLPLIVYPLFVPFAYIVAKQLNPETNWYLHVVTFLAILHMPSYPVPSVVSYVLAILVLGIWLSSIVYTKKVILVLLLYISVIFLHPLTSMYLLIILFIIDIVSLAFCKDPVSWNFKFYKLFPTIIIIWLRWYFSFGKILGGFKAFVISLGGEFLNIHAKDYVMVAKLYDLSFLEIIQIITFKYGEQLLSIFLGSFVFSINLYNILPRSKLKQKTISPTIFLLNIWFGSFLIWTALNFHVHFVHPDRVFKYLSFFSILLVPFLIKYYFEKKFSRSIKMFFGIILGLMTVLSVFSIYSSPLWKVENKQVTQSEFTGWGFLFEKRDHTLRIKDDTKTTQRRFYVTWYGESSWLTSKNILHYNSPESKIPNHFGYNAVSFAGCQYERTTYYVVSKIIKLLYPKVLPNKEERWRWSLEDFLRLESDPTVNTIYRTKDISIYFVLPKKGCY